MPGPIYINGLQTPPPQYEAVSPPPPDSDGNLPPPPPKDDKKDEKKDESKKKETKENPAAPPKMPQGCNYMYDKNHTMLHIFCKTHPVWESKYNDTPKYEESRTIQYTVLTFSAGGSRCSRSA
jgi:hypothetical protein